MVVVQFNVTHFSTSYILYCSLYGIESERHDPSYTAIQQFNGGDIAPIQFHGYNLIASLFTPFYLENLPISLANFFRVWMLLVAFFAYYNQGIGSMVDFSSQFCLNC